MKGIKSFYKYSLVVAIVVLCAGVLSQRVLWWHDKYNENNTELNDTRYGAFLAAQHALYINDFENAAKLISDANPDIDEVREIKNITDFFSGKMPANADKLKNSKDLTSRLIYDAFLINQDKWRDVYDRHSKEEMIIFAPIRIFSAVQSGKTKEAIKFLDSLKIHDSWKSFIRGQIAVLTNDKDTAIKEFANVHPDFMNINDYYYLMSFYQKHEMFEDMEILKNDFAAKPNGMFVLQYSDIPSWEKYDGIKNNLAFGIVQTVSHTQIMIYTDLSLMFLRFAQIVSDDKNSDAINYYLGQYYYNNFGDYKKCFDAIEKNNPLYLFGQLTIADKNKDKHQIEKIARKNPLFTPAINLAVSENVKNGNRGRALRIINRGLKQKNIPDSGRMFFLNLRAYTNLMFDDIKSAQQDLEAIQEIATETTSDIALIHARILEKQNRNLDAAYEYAMNLVKRNTSDVVAWDILGLIVAKKENLENGLEILERIAAVGNVPSFVWEHLGDLYVIQGDKDRAKRAYVQALDLSDDCLIVVPNVQKKLRKIK